MIYMGILNKALLSVNAGGAVQLKGAKTDCFNQPLTVQHLFCVSHTYNYPKHQRLKNM